MRLAGLLAATGLALASVTASAAEEIEVPADKPFLHERTQITFPQRLGGMDRGWVRDVGTGQYDVSALYQTADGATFVSLFVYRAGLPDVSIWFDRARDTMAAREGFEPATHASLVPAPYRPAGSDTPTGLALAYDIAPGQPYTATGAMLFPHGPWLIKLRATSSDMDAAQIAQLMAEIERSLDLPEPPYLSSPAYPVERCTASLETGDAALLAPSRDMVAAVSIMMQDLGKTRRADGTAVRVESPRWCRDDTVGGFAVYRPDNSRDRYVMALGDAGNALQVGIVMGALPQLSAHEQGIPIVYADANTSMLLAFVDRLPDPAAALEIGESADTLATNDRDGNVAIMVSESGN